MKKFGFLAHKRVPVLWQYYTGQFIIIYMYLIYSKVEFNLLTTEQEYGTVVKGLTCDILNPLTTEFLP